jgi:DNA-binding transcriptional LysR family regulator
LLGQFGQRYPAVRLEIELAIGPDIEALFAKGKFDLAIVNREVGEGDGVVLWRERRVWAAAPGLVLYPQEPIPLAVFPAHCGWRRLAIETLETAGISWTLIVQSAGLSGILSAVEAGLAISIFAANDLPNKLKALGPADGVPALPDFEYVLRRKPKAGLAVDRLAEVLIDFFQLSATLREKRVTRQDRSHNVKGTDA